VKFMWGIFACNELLCERFGMVETPNCACCGVVETPWHVVGECGHAERRLRSGWTVGEENVGACAGGDLPTDKPAGYRRSECTAADVAGGGIRRSPPNVATWSEKRHTRY
jgi:hypothetical protein